MDPVMAGDTFNMTVYKKQTANTAKILLREAITLAQARGKKAYVHVVGLGLGVCRTLEEQDELFVEAWGDALMSITDLRHVAFVDFSYVNCNSIYGAKNNQKLPGTEVVVRFSKRNLHDKVPEDCICVCNYAWQGNSLPGSEFWVSKVCSSGDSASSCFSVITEMQKHFINPVVCGSAVRIVAEGGQLLNVSDILAVMKREELNCHELKLPPPTRVSRDHEQTENGINTSEWQVTPAPERYVVPAPDPDPNLDEKDWEDTAGTSFWVHSDEVTNTVGPLHTVVATASASPNSACPAPAPDDDTFRDNDLESHLFEATVELTDEVQETSRVSGMPTAAASVGLKPSRDDAKRIPREICHPIIPGRMIPNPEYVKQNILKKVDTVVPTSSPVKQIPKEICHPTIPGCLIPNPEYIRYNELEKAMKKQARAVAKIEKILMEIRRPTITRLVLDTERMVIPAPEPGLHSNATTWRSSESSSWARDADQTNAPVEPSARVVAAAPRSASPDPSQNPSLNNLELIIPNLDATAEVSDEVQESSSVTEVPTAMPASASVRDIPKEILHPTIPGCTIPNPEYVKQQKELRKAKKSNGALGNSWARDIDRTNAPVAPVRDIPKEILHPTIPGCTIPNPEYVKQQKELRKAKKSNGAWGSSLSSWAHYVDRTNAPVEPSPQVVAAAPVPPRAAWSEPPSHTPTLNNHELETPKFEATAEVTDVVQESPPVVEEPIAKPEPEPAAAPVKEIPKEILHPTIPGCTIPNPEYLKQQKELKKAKIRKIRLRHDNQNDEKKKK